MTSCSDARIHKPSRGVTRDWVAVMQRVDGLETKIHNRSGFVPVPPNLYVNRIYYSVVYQSSLASLVLSGWLRRMNLVGVP